MGETVYYMIHAEVRLNEVAQRYDGCFESERPQ
jgi:hypothetical protein